MKPIYLDYNATTPVDPGVLDAMLPFLREEFGNPSSSYPLGRNARDAIENARAEVASLIGAHPDEIVFTGGGTESSNIAIRSGAKSMAGRTSVVTTTIEHPATDACCALLAQDGYDIRRVGPERNAIVDPGRFERLVDATTALVTVIHAQNEIGTLQPVSDIARIAKANGALMHADAAQSVGKVPVDVNAMGIDLLSIAGHKLYAPKGIGALYMSRGVDLPSVLVGAGQEHGRRPGTENVAFIVALGEACRLAASRLDETMTHTSVIADRLLRRLQADVPDLVLVGDRAKRLPNTLNVLFPGVSGRMLLDRCPGVNASTGSACHADREDASAILLATGLDPQAALGAVRLSVGRHTTLEDADAAAGRLIAAWRVVAQSMRSDPVLVPVL
ncbi:MAG: cysteine desulfurase family protein [Pseudorhodoplanes sp.]